MRTDKNSARVPIDRRRWLVLLVLCAAWSMDVLDFSIVNVALPEIQRDLGFSQKGLQWVVSAYALTLDGFLLLGGLPSVAAVGVSLLPGEETYGHPSHSTMDHHRTGCGPWGLPTVRDHG